VNLGILSDFSIKRGRSVKRYEN